MANLRDLGGMPIAAGSIAPQRLFRSAAPYCFDADARAWLTGARLATIVDLRSAAERADAPTPLPVGVGTVAAAGDGAAGDPAALAGQCTVSTAATRAAIHRIYAAIPRAHAAALTALYTALAEGSTPLLVHCAVGKDRTGAAVAILLAALGTPDAAILDDYLASNDSRAAIGAAFAANPRTAAIRAAPAPVWAPMLVADARYLEALFASLDRDHGGARGYVETAVGSDGLERIAAHLAGG